MDGWILIVGSIDILDIHMVKLYNYSSDSVLTQSRFIMLTPIAEWAQVGGAFELVKGLWPIYVIYPT